MPTLPRVAGDDSWLAQQLYLGFLDRFAIPKSPANITRFTMLVLGMYCSIAISTVFSFSLISRRLQTDYNFAQDDITTISTVGIAIGYFTFPFGMLYDYIGPKPMFAFGVVCNLVGTLLFAASFNGTIGHSVVGLSFINAVVNLGCSLYDIGVVITLLSWFPLDRGMVIACFKTTTGLGSSIISTLYNTFFDGDEASYMYFLAALSSFFGLICLVFFHLPPYHMTGHRKKTYNEEDRHRTAQYMSVYMERRAPLKRFLISFILVFSLLILLTTRSITFVFVENPSPQQKLPSTIIMIVLCLALLLTLLPFTWLDEQPHFYDRQEEDEEERVKGSGPDNIDEDDEREDSKELSLHQIHLLEGRHHLEDSNDASHANSNHLEDDSRHHSSSGMMLMPDDPAQLTFNQKHMVQMDLDATPQDESVAQEGALKKSVWGRLVWTPSHLKSKKLYVSFQQHEGRCWKR